MITKEYIDEAIAQSEAGFPELPEVEGYSSDKIRRLLNWLCKVPEANYLEIGTHTGSTFIPAIYGNDHCIATCIDNWSMFGNQRPVLEERLDRLLPGREVNILEADMFEVDLDLIPPGVTVYFYDGPHEEPEQYAAFHRFDPVFADRFVAVIDDWRWEGPRFGTQRAFRDLRYEVEAEWELPSRNQRDREQWWNRLYVAIINRPGG